MFIMFFPCAAGNDEIANLEKVVLYRGGKMLRKKMERKKMWSGMFEQRHIIVQILSQLVLSYFEVFGRGL